MPYAVDDPESNKENPVSPSVYMSMTEQLLYKIAALDASVNQGFRRIDERLDRVQTDLHESQVTINNRISELDKEFSEDILRKRQRIDDLEKRILAMKAEAEERYRVRCELTDRRINDIETWQKVIVGKASIVLTLGFAFWTVFAPTIRHFFGISN
jgi:DNA anti-recombination protein RmuC